jgi:hypothetical protein
MAKRAPWKYFAVDPDPKNKKRKALFDTDGCENCGVTVLAPNSVWGYDSIAKYKALGMVQRDWDFYESLEELGYSDELGMAVCPQCYDEAVRDKKFAFEAEAGDKVKEAISRVLPITALDAGDRLALGTVLKDLRRAVERIELAVGVDNKVQEFEALRAAYEGLNRATPIITNIMFRFVGK